MRAQIVEKRLQVLMASKRKEVEAEIQSEYQQCTWRQSLERSQVQCALTALRERAFPLLLGRGAVQGSWTGQRCCGHLARKHLLSAHCPASRHARGAAAKSTGQRQQLAGHGHVKTKPSLCEAPGSAEALGPAHPLLGRKAVAGPWLQGVRAESVLQREPSALQCLLLHDCILSGSPSSLQLFFKTISFAFAEPFPPPAGG